MKYTKAKVIVMFTILILLVFKTNMVYANIKDGQVVSKDKIWTIKFNKEILLSEETRNAVVVHNFEGKPVKVNVIIGDDERTISVRPPEGGYNEGEKYTLKIGREIVAKENGKVIKNAVEMTFYIQSKDGIDANIILPSEEEIKAGNMRSASTSAMIEYKDYMYYRNDDDFGTLYRMKKDGSEKELFIDAMVASNMWLDGHNLYFRDLLSIVKVDLDKRSIQSVNLKQYTIGNETKFYVSEKPVLLVVKNDWIYFNEQDEKSSFYKMKNDGTGKVKLTENVINFFIDGDWVYYKDNNNHLNKIKLDGTNDSQIFNEEINSFYVLGDWIFYVNYTVNQIKKVKTDGSSVTTVLAYEAVTFFTIDWFTLIGDSLYYSSSEDSSNNKLYKIKTNTKNNSSIPEVVDSNNCIKIMSIGDSIRYKITGRDFYSMDVYGKNKVMLEHQYVELVGTDSDWIYYIENGQKNSGSAKAYKAKFDGSEKTLLLENEIKSGELDGDYIYYQYGMKVHKRNKDGSNDITIAEQYGMKTKYDIKVDGDWVYYIGCHTEEDNYKNNLYRVKKDGTEDQLVTDQCVSLLDSIDGWVYFTSDDEYNTSTIYRIKGDGSNVEKVASIKGIKTGMNYKVQGEYIYFIGTSNYLYKKKLGSNEEPILIYGNNGNKATSIVGLGKESIYFFTNDIESTTGDQAFYLKQISIKDNKCTTISVTNGLGVGMKDGYIYYMEDITKWVQIQNK